MSELFEIFMIVLFGLSWPANVIKSYKARTTKGKSLMFLICIFVGYLFGITSKLISDSFDWQTKWYVLFFYVLNTFMVGVDLTLYARNAKLDAKMKEESE